MGWWEYKNCQKVPEMERTDRIKENFELGSGG